MALTEWHDLLDRLEKEPDSDILAAMLTDELMEARGMNRTEADRYVATARRSAWDSADMAFLAHVIKAKGPAYYLLLNDVRTRLALYTHETITVFVVAGTDEPRVGNVPTDIPNGAIFHGFPVAIPATWAKNWIKAHGLAVEPVRMPRLPRGAKSRRATGG